MGIESIAVLVVGVPIAVYVLSRLVFYAYFETKRQHTKAVLNDLDHNKDCYNRGE